MGSSKVRSVGLNRGNRPKRKGTETGESEEGGAKVNRKKEGRKVERTSRAGADEANRTADDLRRDRLGAEDSERVARRNMEERKGKGGELEVGGIKKSSTSQRSKWRSRREGASYLSVSMIGGREISLR